MNFFVTCGKCKCEFSLQGKYLKDKTELSCPNCNTLLSDKTLTKLQSLEKSYQQNKCLDDFALSVRVDATLKGSKIKAGL